MSDTARQRTKSFNRYRDSIGGKLSCWYWRNNYNHSFPAIIPLICSAYYQWVDYFIPTEGYIVSDHNQSIERKNEDESQEFSPIIIFGNQCINPQQSKNTISSWKIKVINNQYLPSVSSGAMFGVIEDMPNIHNYIWEMDVGGQDSNFIVITEKFTCLYCTATADSNFVVENSPKQVKNRRSMQAGDIILIKILTTQLPKSTISFSVNNQLIFSAKIKNDKKYRLCASFRREGARAKILSFNKENYKPLSDYNWDDLF